MKSPYCFVISPKGKRYNNTSSVEDKELILNTEVYNHEYVNRKASVISTPIVGSTNISPQDEVIVHHNIFRRWHNIRGEEKNSKSFFDENTYIVGEDQIFLYRKINKPWQSMPGFCWVSPVENKDMTIDKEQKLKGIIKYTDGSFNIGDLVGFMPSSEYEFVVDGERLYRVYSKFITIKYEHKGNEKTYNPSWAQSS
jgi:hypothetical protein